MVFRFWRPNIRFTAVTNSNGSNIRRCEGNSFRLRLSGGNVVEDNRLVPAIGDGDGEYRSRPDALNGSMESHAVGGTAGHHDNARLGYMVARAILLKIVANTHTIG
jgi:hypothetical protein